MYIYVVLGFDVLWRKFTEVNLIKTYMSLVYFSRLLMGAYHLHHTIWSWKTEVTDTCCDEHNKREKLPFSGSKPQSSVNMLIFCT